MMYTFTFQWTASGKKQLKSLQLNQQIVIGSQAGVDVVISDASVSGKHAKITQQGSGLAVQNLSQSAILINNQANLAAGRSRTLNNRDVLKLGNVNLTVTYIQLGDLKVNCSNCGQSISADAATCPNCGAAQTLGSDRTTY